MLHGNADNRDDIVSAVGFNAAQPHVHFTVASGAAAAHNASADTGKGRFGQQHGKETD
jgi:hypothetical protein